MKHRRAREQGAREEDGDGADSAGRVDDAEGFAPDGRVSGVVRRATRGGSEDRGRGASPAPERPRPPERACVTAHDVVEQYHAYVWSIVRRAGVAEEAERITQDVFLAMSELLRKQSMPDDVKAMLTRVTWNKINDELRERVCQRERASGVDPEWLPASSRRNPETVAAWKELMEMGTEVIKGLGPVDEYVIRVAHHASSQEEAAATVGWPAGTFRRRLGEARANFGERLRRFRKKDRGQRPMNDEDEALPRAEAERMKQAIHQALDAADRRFARRRRWRWAVAGSIVTAGVAAAATAILWTKTAESRPAGDEAAASTIARMLGSR